jgi:hypothetical protein
MTNLQTKESLLTNLRAAAKRRPSSEELRKQRVSFILGTLKDTSTVTRAQVTEILAAQEGKNPA